MTKENEEIGRKSAAPKFEVLLILVLFLCFIVWSISKCNDKRKSFQEEEMIRNGEDLVETSSSVNAELMKDTTVDATSNTPKASTTTPAPAPKPVTPPKAVGTNLYITIDGLNMRNHPHLDSMVVTKLSLFETVTFMNEVTDFKQEINLGKEMANEPWVKIQTKRGKVGWVYGAGVHYHKKKREGVE